MRIKGKARGGRGKKELFCLVRHRPLSSFLTDRDRRKGAEWSDVLWSLSDIYDQSRWAIGRGESACDEVFHIAAILVAVIPADKHMRRAKP